MQKSLKLNNKLHIPQNNTQSNTPIKINKVNNSTIVSNSRDNYIKKFFQRRL